MDGPGGTGFKGREMPGSPHHGGTQGVFAAGRAAGIPMPSVPDDTPMMVLGGVVVVVLFIIWIYIQLNPPERRRFLSVPTTKQVDLTSQKGRDHVRWSLTEPDGPYAKISDKEVRMAIPFHAVISPRGKQFCPLCRPQSTDSQRHPRSCCRVADGCVHASVSSWCLNASLYMCSVLLLCRVGGLHFPDSDL